MVDIVPLKVFAVVADVGSFSKAAMLLGVTQSAVSQSVALLEKRYGVTLLDRSDRRKIRLTPQGDSLLFHARRILSEGEALDFLFAHYDALQEPEELKLAFDRALVPSLSGRVLEALYALNPQLQVILCTLEGTAEADYTFTAEGCTPSDAFRDHPLTEYLKKVLK
ncbi:MAG: LysR family transcriptional regulator [Bacteroidales bacterium]|nr:LysR family transcriptional regulator [Bacteroidales bacterium]